jgi:uncharacterized protein (DUF2384 family)
MRVLSEAVSMSRSTLAQRAKAGRFTCAESDRLYSLTTVLDAAYDLLEGTCWWYETGLSHRFADC